MRRRDARRLVYLAFAPSLLAGLAGAVLLVLRPFPYEPRLALLPSLLVGAAAGGALLAVAAVLERTVRSFRWASRATERAVDRLGLSRATAGVLAVATSVGEELLFRGVLLPAIGPVPQALLFGLLHPAGRKGWSYPLFAAFAALALAGVVLVTGRLVPAIVAHTIVNGTGLLSRARGPRRRDGGEGTGGDDERDGHVGRGTPPSERPPP